MKYSIASRCIYYRDGMCYFLASDPRPCTLCFNFASADPKLKRELKIDKPVITFYDLIMGDSRYRALFPSSGTSVQMSLGSLYPGSNELPDDED
ncbi:hypothetical protein AciM339_0748 [Aciduliprofundum sp. MAR08-339]|uniref:hypothetical protein n=1 Tax=Aciduliprofundum sp. (strain MAR08-339) TaxID=673860 RepID=UPI0002A47A7E|nr:hypothetical protein AciM339_0748 [Aciduliprofundum sp. MAR08-339]